MIKEGRKRQPRIKGILHLSMNMLRTMFVSFTLISLSASISAARAIASSNNNTQDTATIDSGIDAVILYITIGVAVVATALATIAVRKLIRLKTENRKIANSIEQQESEKLHLLTSLQASGVQAWRYEVASRQIHNVWGMDAINGRRISEMRELIVDDDFPTFLNMLDLIESGRQKNASIKLRLSSQNGDDEIAEFEMRPIKNSGTVTDIIATIKEVPKPEVIYCPVTEHKDGDNSNDLILENLPLMIAYVDTEHGVKWENMTPKLEQMGCTPQLFATSDDGHKSVADDECRNMLSSTIHELKSFSCIKNISDDIILKLTSTPVINKDNKCCGAILDVTDITELQQITAAFHKIENQILETSNLLQNLIDITPLSIFIKDASNDLRYLWVNKMFCELMNYSASDIIGHNDFELISNERAKMFYDSDIETLNSSIPVVETENTLISENDLRLWRTQKIAITLPGGRKIIIGISSDISELQHTNSALVKAKERAEQSDRLKSAFLANMSHEIRTPLNAIVGFSQLLQDTSDKEEMAEYIKIINENNDLLLRLINDILYLSKIDSGAVEIYPVRTDVADMLEDITTIAVHNNQNPNVEIICDRHYRSCVCNIDRERIMQVWLNFITNAIKYTQKGFIKIGYEYRDNGLYFYVQDSGIGISEEKQDRVFGRFEKLDSFAQGNGLGLSICKAIITMCNGKIGFNSKKFSGSTFYAWVPTEAEIELIDSQKVVTVKKPKAPATGKPNKLNVLVAEDNENNYKLIKKILNFCNTTLAPNGEECVRMVKEGKYDLVLMDIIMPVMDGLVATREIRKFNTEIPIIAVTANTFDTDSAQAIDAGCNEYLPKPINRPLLLNAISKAVPNLL